MQIARTAIIKIQTKTAGPAIPSALLAMGLTSTNAQLARKVISKLISGQVVSTHVPVDFMVTISPRLVQQTHLCQVCTLRMG